mmetsp:Transcript_42945/g.105900  ORF Transcript_42945/g.105900 Transcript_42945/m.105900 type:complete len:468 (+) Transcript_42945:137-1540(+)
MGLAELLHKKGVAVAALHGSGLDVARLSVPEPRGPRFQRLSRLAIIPASKMLATTKQAVEQLTLAAELGALETEVIARQQFENTCTMRLRQAELNSERMRLQFESTHHTDRKFSSRDIHTRQRLHFEEHVIKLRRTHDEQMKAIRARAATEGGDQLDRDVRAFVSEQSRAVEAQADLVDALIEKVNGYLRGTDEQEGLLPSGAVALFGSRATKLSLASSDVDLVLQGDITEAARVDNAARDVMMSLVERLRPEHPDIKFIDAQIPRCKFVDVGSGLTADITAGPSLLMRVGSAPLQHSGVIALDFVRKLQDDCPALRPLVLILKALLRRAQYHEPVMGGLSSHGLVMMVGTLAKIRERDNGPGWLAETPFAVLLLEFLFVYGFEVDYAKVGISLRRGDFFDRVEIGDYLAPLLVEDPLAEAPEDGTVVNVTHVVTSTQLLQGILRSAYSLLTATKITPLSMMASLED